MFTEAVSLLSPDTRGDSIAIAANARRRRGAHRAREVRVVVGEDERREGVGRARVNEARTPLWALPSRFRGEVRVRCGRGERVMLAFSFSNWLFLFSESS